MKHRILWPAMALAAGLFAASLAMAQATITVTDGNGTNVPLVINQGGIGWGMLTDSSASNVLRTITSLNMEPDFTLSVDQKTKIKEAKEAFDKTADTWQTEHKDEMIKAKKGVMDALKAQDQEKTQAAVDAIADINKSMPLVTELDTKLMAILTDDQKKAVESAIDKQSHEPGVPHFEIRNDNEN